MNIISIIDLVNVITAVFLGTLVYSKDPGNKLNRLFLMNSLLSGYTALLEFLRFTAHTASEAFIWHKASFLWPFFPVVFLKYVVNLTGNKLGTNKTVSYLLVLSAIITSMMHLFTNVLYTGLIHEWYGWNFVIEKNIYSAFVPFYTITAGLISFILIFKHYLQLNDGRKRKQVIFTFIAVIIPYITGFVSQVLIPQIGYEIPPLNASSYLLGTVFLSISLLKYKFFIPDPLMTIKQVFEKIEDYLLIYNKKREILLASKSFYDCTLYTEDDVSGKKAECFLQSENDYFPEELTWYYGKETELTIETNDGKKIPISAVVSTIYDNMGKEPLHLLIGRNLSERKQFEKQLKEMHQELENKIQLRTSELAEINAELLKEKEALRRSEERYKMLINTANEGIVVTNENNVIVFVNAKMAELIGYLPDEIEGKNPVRFMFDEDLNDHFRKSESRLKGTSSSYERRYERKDGRVLWTITSVAPITDEEGRYLGSIGMITDITSRKKAEKEIEKYWLSLEDQVKERTLELEVVNRLLQDEIIKQKETEERIKSALAKEHELNEMKSRFISTTSHEFRTPLTTVQSSIELLERYGRNWDTESYFKQVARIKKSVKNLTNLMDDVLLISRAETGKIKFEPKVLDLHRVCLNMMDDIKSLLSENQKINFKYNLLSYDYYLDENLLKLIVSNLLSNAIKYSIKGGEIDFIIKSSDRKIIIEITDRGIGIPEEDQANLFEPFNRGKNVGSIHGTGLGLSIVKKAVDIHEGTIDIESKPDKGTKVKVSIPIR